MNLKKKFNIPLMLVLGTGVVLIFTFVISILALRGSLTILKVRAGSTCTVNDDLVVTGRLDIGCDWSWSDWQASSDDFAYFDSPDCPAGTRAISCATQNFNGTNEYGDDSINAIWVDGLRCRVQVNDTVGGYEHLRQVGVLCCRL